MSVENEAFTIIPGQPFSGLMLLEFLILHTFNRSLTIATAQTKQCCLMAFTNRKSHPPQHYYSNMKYCSHVKTSFRGVGVTDFESFSLNTVKLPASQQHAQQVYLQHSILCMLKCISLPIYKVAFMATWKGGGQDTASGYTKNPTRCEAILSSGKIKLLTIYK